MRWWGGRRVDFQGTLRETRTKASNYISAAQSWTSIIVVQGRHLSVQGGGYNPFLGPEQWRPAQSHPEQQWVWAGSSPGDLHVSSQERGPSRNIYFFSCLEHPPRSAVAETVPVSRSTSGTDCWPTILTTTVPVSSWTGSSSPHAARVGRNKSSKKGFLKIEINYGDIFYCRTLTLIFISCFRCRKNPFHGK